ncbi:hypothetical protein C2G38_2086370 [Gigaspora rosea]|uniref:Uncharacterized protein n=1 Tax=Gigaspora rosea TaxID=44941 RepID=A0A397VB69_9GLOM|nr:hypothetical protein C2G38_2086370 [Gigaspora rosea]
MFKILLYIDSCTKKYYMRIIIYLICIINTSNLFNHSRSEAWASLEKYYYYSRTSHKIKSYLF